MANALAGKRALLTGASGGLGLTLARALAAEGASIVLNDMHARADGACAVIEAEGADVRYMCADVSDPDAVSQLCAAAGEVDIVVNNAVVRHFARVEELAPADWDAALAVNVTAAFHTARLLLPGMRQRGYGRIFNMSSVYAHRASVGRVGYCVAKAAIEALTRSIALEQAGTSVTAHALCPGSTLTPGTDARVRDLQKGGRTRAEAEAAFLQGKQPSGRFVAPESVAAVMLMLCGPAGLDMSGAVLAVDGGWSAS